MTALLTYPSKITTSSPISWVYNPTLETDYVPYSGPIEPSDPAPRYPLWMYHPNLGKQIVHTHVEESNLIGSDPSWTIFDNFPTSPFQHFINPSGGPPIVINTSTSTVAGSIRVLGQFTQINSSSLVTPAVGLVNIVGKSTTVTVTNPVIQANLLVGNDDLTCSVWSPFGGATVNATNHTVTFAGGTFGSLRTAPLTPTNGFLPNTQYIFTVFVSCPTSAPFALAFYDGTLNHLSPDIVSTTAQTAYSFPFTTPATIGVGAIVAIATSVANNAGIFTVRHFKLEQGSTFTGTADVVCPPPTSSGIPTPMLSTWLANNSGAPTVAQILANAPKYNMIVYVFLFNQTGGGSLIIDLSIYGGNGAQLTTDITNWHATPDAKGNRRCILALIADAFAGTSATFLTPTDATNATNTIINIMNTYGFDGIEWDLEGGEQGVDAQFAWNATTINSVNSQLRSAKPNIIISQTPRPFEMHTGSSKRNFITSHDLTQLQYYFGADFGNGPFACGQIQALEGGTDGNSEGLSQFVNGTDGGPTVPASKIAFGQYLTGTGQSGCTAANYLAGFQNLKATFPALRGVGSWQSLVDQGNGYAFATAFGNAFGL